MVVVVTDPAVVLVVVPPPLAGTGIDMHALRPIAAARIPTAVAAVTPYRDRIARPP